MNGKELLEGLNTIEDHLVEEASSSRPPKRTWRSLAACLCIAAVIYAAWDNLPIQQESGAAADIESYQESSPPAEEEKTTQAVLLGVRYIRTSWVDDTAYPKTVLLTSLRELDEYIQMNPHNTSLAEECSRFNGDYFARQDLLMLVLEEGSGSIRHEVLALRPRGEEWVIDLRTIVPEVGTSDMAQWHILLEIPKGTVDDRDTIVVEPVK